MLVAGAESVVRGSVSLGKKLKVSLFAIGIVVVSAGTSLPELANCVRAVISQHPDIAVGDVIGSNIANIILIMGVTALICPIKKTTQNQINQSFINILIAFGLSTATYNYIKFHPWLSAFIFLFIWILTFLFVTHHLNWKS